MLTRRRTAAAQKRALVQGSRDRWDCGGKGYQFRAARLQALHRIKVAVEYSADLVWTNAWHPHVAQRPDQCLPRERTAVAGIGGGHLRQFHSKCPLCGAHSATVVSRRADGDLQSQILS